jgi:SAM-dependent methyltransferase
MKELFSLGKLNISDFLSIENNKEQNQYELKLMLDENGAVRLNECAPLDSMYGKYWYRSGINQTMKDELKTIVDSVVKVSNLYENDIWIDIACNDGTMFEFMPKNVIKIGIDPADDSYFNESNKKADLIIQDFFTADSYNKCKFGNTKAKVVTVIAMFYDLDNPDIFLQDIYKVLDDDGLLVMQMSYTPLMIKQLAFDNICHEHIYYYSLFNIKKLLEKNDFKIVDCQLNDVNGGSFRLYIKKSGKENSFYTQPYRDVCNFKINSLLTYESTLNLESVDTWVDFYNRINELKDITLSFIKNAKKEGKRIWGYGASTKGNTLLQYFGLDNTLIDGIADRNPYKWGLKTSGTNIPIYSDEKMRKAKPDYLLILPWHFIHEFEKREKDYLIGGGEFILPCPKFKIIGL